MQKTIDEAYDPATLRRLQLCQLDILKAFDALCKEHNLTYMAIYGTLLGTVRHKGVIPWDDDIDIYVPRADYERLAELVPLMGEQYTFMNGKIDPRYPFVTSRIMLKGTEFRMWSMRNSPIESGIFLDIFCCDDLPDDERALTRQLRSCWLWEKFTVLKNQPEPNLPYRGWRRTLAYIACAIAHVALKPVSAAWLHRNCQGAASRYSGKTTGRVGWPFGLYARRQSVFKRDMIFPLSTLPFEDMEIPVPAKPHEVSRQTYGDTYMTPPPLGKRSDIIPFRIDFGDGPI